MVKKPNCLSHEAAASIPLVALTMFAALDWLPASKKDVQRKVIVRGASGGCGSWAVQCKWICAPPIGILYSEYNDIDISPSGKTPLRLSRHSYMFQQKYRLCQKSRSRRSHRLHLSARP